MGMMGNAKNPQQTGIGMGGVGLRPAPEPQSAGLGGLRPAPPPIPAPRQRPRIGPAPPDPAGRTARQAEMLQNWTNRPTFNKIGDAGRGPRSSEDIYLPDPGEEQVNGETLVDMSPWESLIDEGAYKPEPMGQRGPQNTGSTSPTRQAAIQAAVAGRGGRRSGQPQASRPKAPATPLTSSNPLSMTGLAPGMTPDASPIPSTNPLSALMLPSGATQGPASGGTGESAQPGEGGGQGMDLLRLLGPVLAAIFYGKMLKR